MIPNLLHKNFYCIIPINNNYSNPAVRGIAGYFNKDLGPYLAGLIEGDGHIYVPLTCRNLNGKKNMPSINPDIHNWEHLNKFYIH